MIRKCIKIISLAMVLFYLCGCSIRKNVETSAPSTDDNAITSEISTDYTSEFETGSESVTFPAESIVEVTETEEDDAENNPSESVEIESADQETTLNPTTPPETEDKFEYGDNQTPFG